MEVVYIVGTKNCGSTLLDTLIGQGPGVRSLGEVGGLYRFVDDAPCDCGMGAVECSTCRCLVSKLRTAGQLGAMCRLFSDVKKEKRILWTVLPTRNRKRYAEISDTIFEAVATETNSDVLVDSTKNIGRAAALVHESRHDVRIVHLIRDGRGFLRSRRQRSPIEGLQYSATGAQIEWLLKNLAIWLFLRPRVAKGRYHLCRYEDLIVDPVGELQRIGAFIDVELSGVAERAAERGVERQLVYEPARAQSYALVRFNPSKLEEQKMTGLANLAYWAAGGFLSRLWRYDYSQSYIQRYRSRAIKDA